MLRSVPPLANAPKVRLYAKQDTDLEWWVTVRMTCAWLMSVILMVASADAVTKPNSGKYVT